MKRRPPRSTRADTLFPYTTLFRSRIPLLLEAAVGDHERTAELEPGRPCHDRAAGECVQEALAVERLGGSLDPGGGQAGGPLRSEEHTSELQSLMRISYAVFCLKKKNNKNHNNQHNGANTRNK